MQHGENEGRILRESWKRGVEPPKVFRNPPELLPGQDLFIQAFFDLCTTRINSMAMGEISWISIAHYCQLQGFAPDTTADMLKAIPVMDREFLAMMAKKQKASEGK